MERMTAPMFCYQCEQTFRGTGCVDYGVCGKDIDVAVLQDLLVFQLEGISFYARELIATGEVIEPRISWFAIEALFSTLTNVNFNRADFIPFLREAQTIKEELRARRGLIPGKQPMAAQYRLPENDAMILSSARLLSVRPHGATNVDLQSLKDTLLFGLKGIAAYAHHAWVLGYQNETVNQHIFNALAAILDEDRTAESLLELLMETGQVNLVCMELLDQANTTTFGHPEPTAVRITHRKGPFIVISGHDLNDLKQLLEQTDGLGINVYTHGEMLPANAYPALKKYAHLSGNYGSAWQNQQREFDEIPGAILMTTNCLMEPRDSYRDRIFTTGVVGWPDVPHISVKDGRKDFSAVISKALELGGWDSDEEERTILTGFARNATLNHAGEIIDAVKSGQVRHFFLVGGCDGARPGRNYYSDFAEKTPADTVILTLACGKFRFNTSEFGTVAGLPRLLDIGQCNDAYSAIRIAVALAEAFNCSVNDLPLTLVLSWYEQKAVSILLTLLSLGIKNIYLGPTLPAFLSENVLNILVEKFGIRPTSSVEADMAEMLSLKV
jgi:hydroxylamine reductase